MFEDTARQMLWQRCLDGEDFGLDMSLTQGFLGHHGLLTWPMNQ